MQKRVTYKELVENNQFKKLLKETERYDGKFKETNGCMAAYYYRIRSLIILGNFHHALELCKEVLSVLDEDHTFLNNIYYFMSEIYFFTKDYKKSLEYHSYCDQEHGSRHKDFKAIISGIAARDPKVHDAVYNRDIAGLVEHLISDHDDDLHIDKSILVKLVMENFAAAKTYHDNFSMYKVFRISFAGTVKDGNSNIPTDYIKVIFKDIDNPNSISTMYPMVNIGDLESADLTRQLGELTNPVHKNGQPSSALVRFRQRQSLKKDKIEISEVL